MKNKPLYRDILDLYIFNNQRLKKKIDSVMATPLRYLSPVRLIKKGVISTSIGTDPIDRLVLEGIPQKEDKKRNTIKRYLYVLYLPLPPPPPPTPPTTILLSNSLTSICCVIITHRAALELLAVVGYY